MTSVPQATTGPAANVSTQRAASPAGLLLVLHPCWGGGIPQLYFQVTNSHDFCTFAVVFHPALTLQHPPRLWGALEEFAVDVSYGLGMLAVMLSPATALLPQRNRRSGSFPGEAKDKKTAYLLMPLLLCSLPVLRPWSVRWHL